MIDPMPQYVIYMPACRSDKGTPVLNIPASHEFRSDIGERRFFDVMRRMAVDGFNVGMKAQHPDFPDMQYDDYEIVMYEDPMHWHQGELRRKGTNYEGSAG